VEILKPTRKSKNENLWKYRSLTILRVNLDPRLVNLKCQLPAEDPTINNLCPQGQNLIFSNKPASILSVAQ
jgi:hypothetical protein